MNVITIEPTSLELSTNGTFTHLMVKSNSESKVAFKVKVTNLEYYRVKPVYGFIEPKASVKLELLRLIGPARDDKMIIQVAEVPNDENDPTGSFKAGAETGEVVIPMKTK